MKFSDEKEEKNAKKKDAPSKIAAMANGQQWRFREDKDEGMKRVKESQEY